ncbi:hypothetical protein [Flavobacterium branchiophilum]|uniref:Uncharacterized protein n=1 Tax=Flavobacterium branchiophilum TaxID=55197 RepID=A0A2H3KIZ5_9FLAO|nr:hypothetical protein [Flavobacterium branchiophilum]PDS21961.1 hypothetical protein B0A77_14660 [Flavobacterium branchiophilum]
MNILFDNNNLKEKSFLYDLKYKSTFNCVYFNHLIDDIIKIILTNNSDKKELNLYLIFNIYSYINSCIISHLNNNDLSVIVNFSDEILNYNERLRELIKIYINNDIKALRNFEDELGKLNLRDL